MLPTSEFQPTQVTILLTQKVGSVFFLIKQKYYKGQSSGPRQNNKQVFKTWFLSKCTYILLRQLTYWMQPSANYFAEEDKNKNIASYRWLVGT